MSAFWRTVLVLGLLALGGSASLPAADDVPAKNPSSAVKKLRPRFTIGKETTVVSGPLDRDGYIDYATALNQRLLRGATPANNANVLFWQALGPRPNGAAMPPEFFEWLGIDPPPERGDYFIDLFRYWRGFIANDLLTEQSDRNMGEPWTAKEYPHFATWLKANEKPLALVVAGTKRSHYFSPLAPPRTAEKTSALVAVYFPTLQGARDLMRTLCTRAMLHVGEGRHDDAWQDLIACHRLARHVGSGGTLMQGIYGIAIDLSASAVDLRFLAHTKHTARQLRDCLRDLQQLPPLPTMAERVDLTERFVSLDLITRVERHGLRSLDGVFAEAQAAAADPKVQQVLEAIHWDPALRTVNRWLDRLVAATSVKDRSVRQKQLAQIEEELRALKGKLGNAKNLGKLLLDRKPSAAARSQLVGEAWSALLVPACSRMQLASDRHEQVQRNLQVAFALAAYQREHGRYPKTLAALAPRYIAEVPLDLFSDRALIYRPSGNGYLLYSVGPNGKDEDGRDFESDPPGDDLSVRMPLPKPRQ